MSTKKPIVIKHFSTYVSLLPGNKGLTIDDAMPYEACEEAIEAYGSIVADGLWALGDLFRFAEANYGERWSQMIDSVKYKLKTIQDSTHVCGTFSPSRRHTALTFNHHKVVTSLADKDFAAAEALLVEAEEKNMTTRQLADLLKEKHPKPPKKSKKPALDADAPQSPEDGSGSTNTALVTYEEFLTHLDLAIAFCELQSKDSVITLEQSDEIKKRQKALDRGLRRLPLKKKAE